MIPDSGKMENVYLDGNTIEYSISGTLNTEINPIRAYSAWYSQAYLMADDVQDNFFAVTTLSPGFQSIDELRFKVRLFMKEFTANQSITEVCLENGKLEDQKPCTNKSILISNDFKNIDMNIADAITIGGNLPLYTFFFTSICMTFLLYSYYLSTIILYLFKTILKHFFNSTATLFNLEEHPITIVSLPIIIIIGLIYFIIGT